MIAAGHDTAQIEYALMLVVLDFQTQVMKSRYQRARVQVDGHRIEVTLSRPATEPAEGGSPEDPVPAEQAHERLFRSGEAQLRDQLERTLGTRVQSLSSRLDWDAGTTVIAITLSGHASVRST